MKIAVYAGTYVKDKDGAVRSIYQLVGSLLQGGHEVSVWSPDVSPQGDASVSVHRVPSMPIPLYPAYRLGFFRRSISEELDRFAPDVIHISTPDIVGNRFLRYGQQKGIPVASAFHTDFPSYLKYYRLGFAEPLMWNYLIRFYNACDVVLAPNEITRRKLASKGINNLELWSRGVDRALFTPSRRSEKLRGDWRSEGKTVFIYAGRFVTYKDVDVVMSLYDRFMDCGYGDRVRFVMIGSGPEEARMRERMPEAVFTGYLTGERLPQAYASGDVFLFPSTTEAFCNVALEALACGLPSVVSDQGGCMELVRRSGAGFVCAAGDIDSFFDACRCLHDEPARHAGMKAAGLSFAEDKTWAKINQELIDRYDRMCAAKQGRS